MALLYLSVAHTAYEDYQNALNNLNESMAICE